MMRLREVMLCLVPLVLLLSCACPPCPEVKCPEVRFPEIRMPPHTAVFRLEIKANGPIFLMMPQGAEVPNATDGAKPKDAKPQKQDETKPKGKKT